MKKVDFKPSEFYRKQRPGNFSDSYEKKENTLTPELLNFELSQITTNQKHDLFEDLCIEIAGNLICPNLIPQTGPTGGGDGKTDSETYPVSDGISIKWYIPENGWEKDEKWAFAVSAKKNWKDKVKSDVKKIVETGRGYTQVYFFTNQTPSSKQKSDIQDQLKNDYKIDVTILDGKWISNNIFSKELINLAVKKLNLSNSFKVEHVLGSNDIERKNTLDELEAKINHPDRYIEFDYQIVMDSINAANISRHLELPKSDTIGKYERAKRLNKKFGSKKLDIQISYQLAWTNFMYFDDYQGFITEYLNFSELFRDYHDIDDLEFYSTLIQLLKTLSKQIDLSIYNVNMFDIEENYFKTLNYFINENGKNTNHYIAKGYKVMYQITQAIFDGSDVTLFLKELKEIINESKNLLRFPFNVFKDLIEVLGKILVDSNEYDELIILLAEIDSKRNSEISSGIIMLKRGMQKIKGKFYKEAVIFLGKSIVKLAKEESEHELYYAFLGLSIGYNKLGLNWVYYSSLLSALHLKMQYFFKSGSVNKSIISLLKDIIKFEIIAGRIPSLLTWYELYLILSSQTDGESKEERTSFTQEIDRFVSVMIANIDFDKLAKATKLPSIFNDFGLEISKDTTLYILQGKESLDEETIRGIGGESKIEEFFSLLMNQPLRNQFISDVDLFYKQEFYQFKSKVLGTNIKVLFQGNVLYVESFISFIEGFLGTSFDIYPTVNDITIHLNFIESDEVPKVDYKLNHHEYTINFDPSFPDINTSFFNSLVFILSHSFVGITKEKLEKLFSSDEVFERISLITSHHNIYKNIIGGESKFKLENFEKSNYQEVKVLNTKSPLNSNIIKDKEVNDSKERHDNREIQSIINIPLWDKAKWNSFAFVTGNPREEFGLVVFFADREFGRKIANELRDKFGNIDEDNTIRISIIKGINPKDRFHYGVQISNEIDKKNVNGSIIGIACRNNIMTPSNDTTLKNIEGLYKIHGKYTLYFGYLNMESGEQEVFLDLGIDKKKLYIKDTKDIGENDIESIVLQNQKTL